MVRQDPRVTVSLDGLRGLLALWVVVAHISQFVGGPGGLLTRGGIAVDLFMLVSGFLMVWTVSARENREPTSSPATWLKFFTRRFFRIAPVFFLLLIPAYTLEDYFARLVVDVYAAAGFGFDRPFRDCAPSTFVDILLHLTFLFGLFPCSASSNVLPDWSLSLEMQFYLVFPLLFLLLTRYKTAGILTALLCVVIAGWSQSVVSLFVVNPDSLLSLPQPSILPLRINCFLVGMALALLVWRRDKDPWLLLLLLVSLVSFQRTTFIALAGGLVLMLLARADLWLHWSAPVLSPLRVFERLLCSRPLRFLGDVSFSVYLVHNLILLPLIGNLNHSPGFLALGGTAKFFVVALLAVPIILVVAWALYWAVERPMIERGRQLTMAGARS